MGFARNAAWLWVRAFQRLASPGDGDRCTFYPSCSAYAARAVRDEGPVLGTWLATGRLLRDHGERGDELCVSGDRLLTVDRAADSAWWRR